MSNFVFRRVHPQVAKYLPIWERNRDAYSGGADYIKKALIRHVSEVEIEFEERVARAYYLNYPRKLARIISQYVLSQAPERPDIDVDIIDDWSRTGLSTNEVMRQLLTFVTCYGSGWLIVDTPYMGGEKITLADKKARRVRPFCRALLPWQVVDWSYAEDGLLSWAIVQEVSVDSSDPHSAPKQIIRRRLWTRTDWTLYEDVRAAGTEHENSAFTQASVLGTVEIKATGSHGLGVVPLVRCEEADGFGIGANPWFEDVVRLSDAILNMESEAHTNNIKQMFGLLVLSSAFVAGEPKQQIDSGGGSSAFANALSRTTAIWETAEERGITRYISPQGALTDSLRSEITNLKKEMYDVVGMAVQKDSKTNQTAESKEWDNHNVEQFLISRVEMLEQAEYQAWKLFNLWDRSIAVPDVKYSRSFSVIDLEKSVAAALDLQQIVATDAGKKSLQRVANQLITKIGTVGDDDIAAMREAVDNMTFAEDTPEINNNFEV